MRKTILFLMLSFQLFQFAQINDWALELNYPMVIDNNFVGQNFNGVLELGINYNLHEALNYRLNASLHNSLFKDRSEIIDVGTDFNYLLWLIQPRLKVDFILNNMPNIQPYLGVGYSFMLPFTNGNTATFFPQDGSSRSGFNVIVGLSFDINERLYANGGYDFVRLSPFGTVNSAYLQNINVLKLGVGYRF
jgi:opacity protein-like surface antigen